MRYSVIIAARNGQPLLTYCLTAFRAVEYPRDDFEIVVVDAASRLPAATVVDMHTHALPLQCYRTENPNLAAARNLGLRNARGEFAIFLDDDCLPRDQWLHAFDGAFAEKPGAAWSGPVVADSDNTLSGFAAHAIQATIQDSAGHGRPYFRANNVAFPRKELLGLGGWDARYPLAEEAGLALGDRWERHYPIAFHAAAQVAQTRRIRFSELCAQEFQEGRGAFFSYLETGLLAPRGPAFYGRLLRTPWRDHRPLRAIAVSTLLALSQVAKFAGFLRERLVP